MNNILAACLLSSLIACTLDDPYMPVNPEENRLLLWLRSISLSL